MQINFTPDEQQELDISVPYIEDARADVAPFYASNKTIKQAQADVEKNLAKLGAAIQRFQSGKFDVNGQARFGYVVMFSWRGAIGQIQIAGLPIRSFSSSKEEQVRVQALLNVAQWLQSLVTQQVFSPGTNPLVPYLLAADGKTIMEHILESGAVPMLDAPRDHIVEAEIEEI